MNDLISREAALKKIIKIYDSWGLLDIEGTEVVEAIKNLPSAQQWILCNERLPEDEQEILFYTKTERVFSGKYYDDGSLRRWYSYKGEARAWNNIVVAWQPLPESYVEGEK